MHNLIINKLYIFSTSEKKAKIVSFKSGKNIITSSRTDGNKKGKSIILKSIYHTLGADCFFDDTWDEKNKTYILDFSINNKRYLIYRYDRLFKVFDSSNELLLNTIDRMELSEFLSDIYQFNIELPSRDHDKLELTPPVFSYILNYLDQDKMDGTHFNSFKSLGQYSSYKENVLYSHFGVFDKEYYELIKRIDLLNEMQRHYNEEVIMLNKMLERIDKSLENNSYSLSLDSLRKEVEKNKNEYAYIVNKMNVTKNSLINLRNEKYTLLSNLKDLNLSVNLAKTELHDINNHVCPLCKAEIKDDLESRIEKCNTIDDLFFLSNELEVSLLKIDKEIKKQENVYKTTLDALQEYERKLNMNSKEINDALKHKGYIEVKDSLLKDWNTKSEELEKIAEKLKAENKEKRKYDDLKKQVNKKYCEYMIIDKQKFGLKELDSKNFENIKNTFVAGGSNKPIATVIWYFNLLRVKHLFNPNAIKFPLILDSPNNVELDDEKRQILFYYLFENIDKDTQLIISTLGFNSEDYNDISFDNIIDLDHNKYELLTLKEYDQYKSFLLNLSNIIPQE